MKLVVNRVIRILILSDFVLYFSIGLFSPIFAIFILDRIGGGGIDGSLEVVGLAVTVHWIARILTTIPISKFMDRTKGELDEYYIMIAGTVMISVLPLFYLVSSLPWHIYVIQFFMGIAGSMASPAWRIMFTNHLDFGETGYEWSLEDVAAGIAVASSAYIGAVVAEAYGFEVLIYALVILGLLGTLILIPLYKDVAGVRSLRRLRYKRKTHHKGRTKKHIRAGVHGI